MRTKSVVLATSLILLGVIIAVYMANATSYEKFNADFDNGTETVYAECTCYGPMAVAESYPPQYSCEGVEMCKDTNYTRKRK